MARLFFPERMHKAFAKELRQKTRNTLRFSDDSISRIEVPNWYKEKLHDLFHFANQLLYSLVSVTCVTATRDVNHRNAVNRKRREPTPQY
jgi:hypothetical protein